MHIIRHYDQMEEKYHTEGRVPKSNIKIVDRGKIETLSTQIHYRSLTVLVQTLKQTGLIDR